MYDKQQTNGEQAQLWNGSSGQAWTRMQTALDALYRPIERLLVDAVRARAARRVLDIGCGTGATTLALARALGANGACTGVDISAPMIALARERATQERSTAQFLQADAQTHAFAPGTFDMLVSRFGVMFFDDPAEAFANLRRAASAQAQLCWVAWRDARENPFMTTAERAAKPWLPHMPAREPDAPGQFAFADENRVARLLERGGWAAIDIRPIDIECSFPAAELEDHFTRLGPLARVLPDTDEATRRTIVEHVRAAFAPYVHGERVRFIAACWRIGAKAG